MAYSLNLEQHMSFGY